MNRNVKIAKELVRLAKSLVAEESYTAFNEMVNFIKVNGPIIFADQFSYADEWCKAYFGDGMVITLDYESQERFDADRRSPRQIVRGDRFQAEFSNAMDVTWEIMVEKDEFDAALQEEMENMREEGEDGDEDEAYGTLFESLREACQMAGTFMPSQEVIVRIGGVEQEERYPWHNGMWYGIEQ